MPITIFIPPSQAPGAAGGPELDADTHGSVVVGTGGTAAADVSIGTITLPADGPWNIFGAWAQVVQATGTAADALVGSFFFRSVQGDVDPNPSPIRMPLTENPSLLGATSDVMASPLQIWPIAYSAPGKAQIEMFVTFDAAPAVAPQVAIGLIYGKKIPESRPFTFIDRATAQITSAADTSIGTITLAEKARHIHAICGMLTQDNVITTAEELIGFFRLESADAKMQPAQYPFSMAYSAGLGALINQGHPSVPVWIPCDIPIVGGARINCFCDLNTAVTNAANVQVFIAYE